MKTSKSISSAEISSQNNENLHPYSLLRIRVAVSAFYFGQGICFATWASRIPDIKSDLNLSDAALGSILLALPAGQLMTMPISSRLTAKHSSRKMMILATPFYALCLTNIAMVSAAWQLALCLLLFGIVGNLSNIALNTQAVVAENFIKKPIMSSFHGFWSLGMFTGALIGLLALNLHANLYIHFWVVAVFALLNIFINYKYIVPGGNSGNTEKKKLFVKPEGVLILLGIIAFCSMATEGAMMDWSGVYFKDVVKAPSELIILGYASYAAMMTMGRFVGDKIIAKYGRKLLLQASGLTIFIGMGLSVFLPNIIATTIGFMIVGMGVSTIIPIAYSIAGNNNKVPASIAIAMVSSIGYFGFLFGPPLIGYISEITSLQYSYGLIAIFGLIITFLVSKISLKTIQ